MRRQNLPRTRAASAIGIGAGVLGLLLLLGLWRFYATADQLPQNVYLGDVNVSGLTREQALARVNAILKEPVILRHSGQTFPIIPGNVGFTVNEGVANVSIQLVLDAKRGLARFPAWLAASLRPMPSETQRLPAPINYDTQRLGQSLREVAEQINRSPRAPAPGAPGQDGLQLAVGDATELIVKALNSSNQRVVDLPVDVVPADPLRLKALSDVMGKTLAAYMQQNPTHIVGMYLKDLRTGEESGQYADVAFGVPGWLRVFAALEATRATGLEGALRARASAALVNGDDLAYVELLAAGGGADAARGVSSLNANMKKLGFVNTYLNAPPGQRGQPVSIVTDGNTRAQQLGMRLDADAQSTPAEVALLLETLEQCRAGGGALLLAYAGQLTRERCDTLLTVLAGNDQNALLGNGTEAAQIYRRQSVSASTHADAALVRAPSGSYVLSVVIHAPNGAPSWDSSAALMRDLATSSHVYFNAGAAPAPKPAPALPPGP